MEEAQFQQYVLRSSVPIVRYVLQAAHDKQAADTEAARAAGGGGGSPAVSAPLSPGQADGERMIRDAWGNPIAYLPGQHPNIGMAPQNRPFFVSAGPDGKFLTRDDNLYSYEQIRIDPSIGRPSAGGHGE